MPLSLARASVVVLSFLASDHRLSPGSMVYEVGAAPPPTEVPVLGSGKLDYVGVSHLVRERAKTPEPTVAV